MARLPRLWSDPDAQFDNNNWGTLLNEYLRTEHNADGTHVASLTRPIPFTVASTASVTLTASDLYHIHVPATTAAQAYTLPSVGAVPNGAWLSFVNTAGYQAAGVKGNPLTITRAGTDTIFQRNGIQTSQIVLEAGVYMRHEVLTLASNGTYWFVVGGSPEVMQMTGLEDGHIRCTSLAVDTVTISPYNGNGIALYDSTAQQWRLFAISNAGLSVNVTNCTIDGVAGQSLGAAGNIDKDFWIYLYLSAGIPAIEFSQTASTQEAITGYFVKTGVQTRRLVGGTRFMSGGVRLGVGAQNNNTGSYFNRLRINPSRSVTGNDASGNWVALTTALTRLTFWTWADGAEPMVMILGSVQGALAGQLVRVGISRDGASPPQNFSVFQPYANNAIGSLAVGSTNNANSEGLHTYDLMIQTDTPGSAASIANEAVLVGLLQG